MLEYDTGMPLMKWRIAQWELILVNRMLAKPVDNIRRKVQIQDFINKIKGLATEYRTLSLSLGLPSLMAKEATKNEIKHAIKNKNQRGMLKKNARRQQVRRQSRPQP